VAKRGNVIALAAGAATVGAGLVAQRVAVSRRRNKDPEAHEPFGVRRGTRRRMVDLDDGARLFVEEVGPESERGAIFIHGSALRTDAWHYQLEGLGDHRLVFYDLRGHGVSQPRGEKPFKIQTLADDLLVLIEDSGLKECVLVGHSIGGMIALELCARHKDLMGSTIAGLVLSNTTYRPAVETLAGGAAISHLERLTRRPFDGLGSQHQRLDRLRRIIKPSDAIFMAVSFAAFGPNASARQIDFTYDMLAETPTDILFELIKSYREFDVRDVLGEITVPALVIGGEHDRLTVSDASRHLAENLPKAELVMLEDCGHMTMLEKHDEFNELIEGFLNDNLGRPKGRSSSNTRAVAAGRRNKKVMD
jgi:pimeloyl-ACP methyl ester carboxylesterase